MIRLHRSVWQGIERVATATVRWDREAGGMQRRYPLGHFTLLQSIIQRPGSGGGGLYSVCVCL